jgi:hypothetical protein
MDRFFSFQIVVGVYVENTLGIEIVGKMVEVSE